MKKLASLCLLTMVFSPVTRGQVYKCEQEGQMSYQSTPCKGGDQLGIAASTAPAGLRNAPTRPLPLELPENQIQATMLNYLAHVRKRLEDPNSAKFRSLHLLRAERLEKEDYFLCGEINTKDHYHNYLGFQWFFISYSSGYQAFIGEKEILEAKQQVGELEYNFTEAIYYCMLDKSNSRRIITNILKKIASR